MLWKALILLSLCAAEPSGKVAFLSGTEQEDQVVCVLDLATNTVARVGPGRRDGPPVWSPQGDWLAFEAQDDGRMAIHVARPDGSGLRALAHGASWNTHPRWSPDGRRLAYVAGGAAEGRIAVYDLQTDTETLWGGDAVGLFRPVWVPLRSPLPQLLGISPDSVLAVAVRPAGENGPVTTELVGVDAARVAQVPATLPEYFEWAVEPDPRGRALAYESNDGGDREIYVASLRGINNVSNHRAADWNPVWSPDGKWLAFESFRAGRRGIYRTFPETSRVYPVAVALDHDNWAPTWSPDGAWLAFVSDRDGYPELYICDIGGDGLRQAASGAGMRLAPAWQPRPEDR